MTLLTPSAVTRFIQSFAENNESGDVQKTVACFADSFLAAGPQGAQPVQSADFARMLPKRKQMFEQLGCRSITLTSVEEMPLDARFVLARTAWQLTAIGSSGQRPREITLRSDYIIDTGTDPWKFVFYLSHQDPITLLGKPAAM